MTKKKIIISRSAAQTKRLASNVIQSGARVIALTGELGSGKTTFVQGLARALGIRRRITSPTFIVFNKRPIPLRGRARPWKYFCHVDLYRVHRVQDLRTLGFRELLRNPENFVAVEWAELAKRFIPRSATRVTFQHGRHERERVLVIK